jgi:hypothetical protein
MPRYEDVIGQFAGRSPGTPAAPMVPGGSPTAPGPMAPAPPGVNSAPPGRSPGMPPPMGGPQITEPKTTQTEATAENGEQQKNTQQARPSLRLNRMPLPGEMLGMPPGIQVETPYGLLDDEGNIQKSPEYEQKHKEAIVRARQKFGPHPWNGMAGAPEPNIELGKSHFNPFTNQMGRAE